MTSSLSAHELVVNCFEYIYNVLAQICYARSWYAGSMSETKDSKTSKAKEPILVEQPRPRTAMSRSRSSSEDENVTTSAPAVSVDTDAAAAQQMTERQGGAGATMQTTDAMVACDATKCTIMKGPTHASLQSQSMAESSSESATEASSKDFYELSSMYVSNTDPNQPIKVRPHASIASLSESACELFAKEAKLRASAAN